MTAVIILIALIGGILLVCLIVAGIYLLLGIIIWAARIKLLQLPIMNALLKEFFKDDESDEED